MKQHFYYGIASGSKGNSGLYVVGDTCILIDLGVSYRKLTEAMKTISMQPSDIDLVLVTHEHIDHVRGLSQLCKRNDLTLVASPETCDAVGDKYPDLRQAFQRMDAGESVRLHNSDITAFSLPHDAENCLGFVIQTESYRFGYATDLGFMPREAMEHLHGCDIVILESNHDPNMLQVGPYPYMLKQRVAGPGGHLSNPDCAVCATKLAQTGTKHFVLSHLSETNNMPELAHQQTALSLRAFPACAVHVAPVGAMDAPIFLETEDKLCSPFASFA